MPQRDLLLTASPSTTHELGQALRTLRSPRGLRQLVKEQDADPGTYQITISKTQLGRYEAGELVPPLEHAKHLDALYRGNGWVEMALHSLWRSKWDPWASANGSPRFVHAVRWPARYSGAVWIKIVPESANVGVSHEVDIEWGPWKRGVRVELPSSGILLLTGKATDEDGISRTCNITCHRRIFLLNGADDELDDEHVIDIRRGWRLAPGEAAHDTPDDNTR